MDAYCVECRKADALVWLQGETSPAVMAGLKKEVEPLFQNAAITRVVVDLAQVTFIDTTGINFLVTLSNKGAEAGKRLFLQRPSDRVQKVLRLVQLEDHFHYLPPGEVLE